MICLQPVGNPDEVTVQDMKQARDNPSLGLKFMDGRKTNERAIAKVDRVTLRPLSCIEWSFLCRGGTQFPLSICQFRVSPFARSVV